MARKEQPFVLDKVNFSEVPPGITLDTSCETHLPEYVDNELVLFEHDKTSLKIIFLSDWNKVERFSSTSEFCPIYFPSMIDLEVDQSIELRLIDGLKSWSMLNHFRSSFRDYGIYLARLCSLPSQISFEQRKLLHRHLTWIFMMDEVSEQLPNYNLHDTAGQKYLQSLKGIMKGEPIYDMSDFIGQCPDELIEMASNVQRVLSEDIMPLLRRILLKPHVEKYIATQNLFFDKQYEEGHHFSAQARLPDIIPSRTFTIGTSVVFLLYMTSDQAELYSPDDPCVNQLSLYIALFNDIIGLNRDLDNSQTGDSSVGMNLVSTTMREQGMTADEALRSCTRALNYLSRYFLFHLGIYPHERQKLYRDCLKTTLGLFDYHLKGAQGSFNARYGWRPKNC